jgi:TonB family protein
MAARLLRDRAIRIKGEKTLTKVGNLTAIIDNSTSTITLLNPGTKQYAQVSMSEYIDALHGDVPPAAAALMKYLTVNAETTKTGQSGTFAGIRAEEKLMTINMSTAGEGAPQIPSLRVELHMWLAGSDELSRVPGLQPYAASAQPALRDSSAEDAVEKLFRQAPGIAEKLRAVVDTARSPGELVVKTQELVYDAKFRPNDPMFTLTITLAEISSDAIDNSLFEVPPDFQQSSLEELIKASAPAGSAPKPANPAPGEQGSKMRGPVSAPTLIYKTNPAYSKEALQAKLEGTVTLSIVVDKAGAPTSIQVMKPLGLGLDEKAIEAVKQWKFLPGQKDGQPVNVLATVEVNFRLLDRPPQQ